MCATRQLLVLVFAAVGQVFAADLPDAQYTEDAAKALVTTYPTYVEAGDEPGTLRWMDGTAVDFRAPEQVRPHALMLDDGTLWEQMLQAYPKGWPYAVPKANQDPGRIRCEAFFKKIYGETERDVRHYLVAVPWPPSGPAGKLRFSRVNGAAEALARVGEDLAAWRGPGLCSYIRGHVQLAHSRRDGQAQHAQFRHRHRLQDAKPSGRLLAMAVQG
ncbi:MAG: hypothetical protein KJ052_15530 [Candidatus Hydrogenedentes bacterium]|nr:hypothetical protein [Candidatus Hydrogenedentota bacterium]